MNLSWEVTSIALRVVAYLVLPILIGWIHSRRDPTATTRALRLEILLMYMFGVGLGANGLGGFFGHIFLSDIVAKSIGWPTGSPFQLEMGFANLAIGLMGFVAVTQREGFRTAAILGSTTLKFGAFLVHMYDLALHANLAPSNILINFTNIFVPVLLIWWTLAQRRAERAEDTQYDAEWMKRVSAYVLFVAAGIGTGFGVGFAIGETIPAYAVTIGAAVAGLVIASMVTRDGNMAAMAE